ncbi:hypothetical protein EBH_0010340 [Eimeria brunetti]|uniref:Uncharacterized protein n=1 Tax=Eimeria brunetti TaxID=51314 RepID=U6LBL5_9EIME|nr:hypothetical protein EBH_0010340 [Eimeria brunetti]
MVAATLPEGEWNTSGEDSRHAPLTSEELPVPTGTREEQSGSDTSSCEDSARKRTQEVTQRNEDESAADLPWWREGTPLGLAQECYGSLCGTGKTAALKLEVAGYEWECFTGDFLVGSVPYDVILGLDWLIHHRVAWYFQSEKFRTYVNGRQCELLVQRKSNGPTADTPATGGKAKTARDRAYDVLAQQVSSVTAQEAATLRRRPPKRYNSRHRADERVKIKDLLREARRGTENLERALGGLQLIAALPEAEAQRVAAERQGLLMCAIVEHHQAKTRSQDVQCAVVAAPGDADTEDSPWRTAELEYTEFDAWSQGHDELRLPPQILTVQQQHRLLFPDRLPDGKHPKPHHDHQIPLLPGNLPTKAPIRQNVT